MNRSLPHTSRGLSGIDSDIIDAAQRCAGRIFTRFSDGIAFALAFDEPAASTAFGVSTLPAHAPLTAS
jgi:hypothetical protein